MYGPARFVLDHSCAMSAIDSGLDGWIFYLFTSKGCLLLLVTGVSWTVLFQLVELLMVCCQAVRASDWIKVVWVSHIIV